MSVYPISEENTINNNNNTLITDDKINNDNKYPSNNTNNDKNIKNNNVSPHDKKSCPERWLYVDPLRFIRIILTLIALILYVVGTTKKPFLFMSGNFDTTEPVEGGGNLRATANATIEMYFIKLNFCIEAKVDVDVPADINETMDNMNMEKECKEIKFNNIPDELTLRNETFDLKEITKDIKDPMNSIHKLVTSNAILIGVVLIIYILSIIRSTLTNVLGIIASIVTFCCAFVSLSLGAFVSSLSMLPLNEMANKETSGVETKLEANTSVETMLMFAALFLMCVAFCICICCLSCRRCCCCCCRKESCLDPDDDM